MRCGRRIDWRCGSRLRRRRRQRGRGLCRRSRRLNQLGALRSARRTSAQPSLVALRQCLRRRHQRCRLDWCGLLLNDGFTDRRYSCASASAARLGITACLNIFGADGHRALDALGTRHDAWTYLECWQRATPSCRYIFRLNARIDREDRPSALDNHCAIHDDRALDVDVGLPRRQVERSQN